MARLSSHIIAGLKPILKGTLPAALTALGLARTARPAQAHPVAPLLAIAGLIALSDLHWPYATEIMQTLDPFCDQEDLRRAWLETVRDADGGVLIASETAKMASMVKLLGRLQGWVESRGCVGRIPPYSSRRDSRAWSKAPAAQAGP
jgi:hypothetical protein